MKLSCAVEEYVSAKRSMGMRFRTQADTLRAFSQAMGPVSIRDVSPPLALAFLATSGRVTTSWHQRFWTIRGLYRFAIPRGYAASCPLPDILPKRPPYATPYIYSVGELQRLLSAATILGGRNGGLGRAAFRTLILLLYGSGLRINEALTLNVNDVDLAEGLLVINKTKFDKSRLVPIGPKLIAALRHHVEQGPGQPRRLLPSKFFVTVNGLSLDPQIADRDFRIVRGAARIHREDGAFFQPRLHDLRHTFAVHRLTSWYRSGADVQRLLPKLSTYLGHVGIAETAHYLTMTPELLNEASRRFEHYAFPEVSHHV